MAKFGKKPAMPMLDTGEGAPTLGKSSAKTVSNDGTTRGKKGKAPKMRSTFGAMGGGAKLKAAKPAKADTGGGGSRAGYGSFTMPGAGNMAADTKKYGAMMGKGKK